MLFRSNLSVNLKKQLASDSKISAKEKARALIDDIKKRIKDDWDKSAIETLEVTLWEWKYPDDCITERIWR